MANDEASGSPSVADSDLHPASDGDDDYVDDGMVENDDGMAEENADEESDFVDEPDDDFAGRPKGKGKAKAKPKARASKAKTQRMPVPLAPVNSWSVPEGAKRSTVLALEASELMAFPPVYRDYLVASSTSIARTPNERGPAGGIKLSVFPIGPVTPFTTRLVEPASGGEASIAVDRDSDNATVRENARRDHMREIAKQVSVIVPWDLWQGEPWFKEMYDKQAIQVDGAELPVGWSLPLEVRLGLDTVGPTPEVLPVSVGEQYLPQTEGLQVFLGSGANPARIQIPHFGSTPFATACQTSSGVVFNTGGPVWGLDWCPHPESTTGIQHLAVSTAYNDLPIGSCGPSDARGAIQVWSVNAEGTLARCELVLCVQGGAALDLKWMPLGGWDGDGGSRKLGILAVVQEDGSVSFYSVPKPPPSSDQPVYIRAPCLLKLSIPDASVTCIDWLSGFRIIAGLSNGYMAIWDVECLAEGSSVPPLPSHYFPVTISPLRSIAAGRCPPTEADGVYDYSGDAVFSVYSSWDGTSGMVDLRDPSSAMELNRARLPAMAIAWSPQLATPLYADVDYMVTIAQVRLHGPLSFLVAPHRGPLWDIATSDYHTMVASCASDGAVVVANVGMGFYRRKNGGLLYQRLYELDYDEHKDEYRMTDSFMPESSSLEDALKHSKKKGTKGNGSDQAPMDGDVTSIKTAVWARNVGIHKVSWHSGAGIKSAGYLASGGYAGLVRIDRLGQQK